MAGHGFGYQFMQFQSFVAVVVWLCTMKLGGQVEKEALKIDANQDSPAMVAKQILRILQVFSIVLSLTYGNGTVHKKRSDR